MYLLSIILEFILLGTSTVYDSCHCKDGRHRTSAEQLARLRPKAELDLIDLDLFPGGSVVARVKYEVGPAYNKGLSNRKTEVLNFDLRYEFLREHFAGPSIDCQ